MAIAVGAGVGAIALVQGELKRAREAVPQTQAMVPPPPPQPKAPAVDVLVASRELRMGQTLRPEDLRWEPWPIEKVSEFYITAENAPQAREDTVGIVVRQGFVSGEPIREEKLIRLDRPGIMSALLRDGMRAISIKIGAETSAGGFILPGDYVDVIFVREQKALSTTGESQKLTVSQTILSSVRVLAIDQTFSEDSSGVSTIGRTATVEVKPEQAEILALAEKDGNLQLALRGITELLNADSDAPAEPMPVTVRDIRRGVEEPEKEKGDHRIMMIRSTMKQPTVIQK
ncbi:MAG: Flp pilus assembly protein CpaB [Neomegalonema sp.]|nr:Flp pilus assembly protein CpaB [Neomegalonema sp.]